MNEPRAPTPLPDFLQSVLGHLDAHPYLLLFVGMLFAGELVLLPAIFLSVSGRLALAYVIAIAVTVTMLKDLGLYYLGRLFPATALQRLPGRGTNRLVMGLERLFERRGAHVVFWSKFVYGTRSIAQILAGVHDLPLRPYFTANALGTAALTLTLSGVAWFVAHTARRYDDFVHSAEIAFVVFVLLAAIAYVSAAIIARRRWSQ